MKLQSQISSSYSFIKSLNAYQGVPTKVRVFSRVLPPCVSHPETPKSAILTIVQQRIINRFWTNIQIKTLMSKYLWTL